VNPETGHLLEIGDDGSYSYVDDVSGTEVVASAQGELALTADPGTMEGTCKGGGIVAELQVGVTPEVAQYVESHGALKVTSSGGTPCTGFAIDGVWVNISWV